MSQAESSMHLHSHQPFTTDKHLEETLDNFSSILKTRTKDVHRIVETKPIMKQIMKCQLPVDRYVHLLRGLARIYE